MYNLYICIDFIYIMEWLVGNENQGTALKTIPTQSNFECPLNEWFITSIINTTLPPHTIGLTAMGHIGSPRAAQEKFRISRHTEPWQRAGRLSSAAFDPTFFLAENMESILLLWDRIAEVNCEVITVYPLVWGSSWFTCWFVHPKLGRQRWPIWIANPLWHIWHVSFLGQAGISPFWGKS